MLTLQRGVWVVFLLWRCSRSPFSHCRVWEEEISCSPGSGKTHWSTEGCWLNTVELRLEVIRFSSSHLIKIHSGIECGLPIRSTVAAQEDKAVLNHSKTVKQLSIINNKTNNWDCFLYWYTLECLCSWQSCFSCNLRPVCANESWSPASVQPLSAVVWGLGA